MSGHWKHYRSLLLLISDATMICFTKVYLGECFFLTHFFLKEISHTNSAEDIKMIPSWQTCQGRQARNKSEALEASDTAIQLLIIFWKW